MEKLIRSLSSYRASIILLLIYAVGLATATLVEKQMGTVAAKMLIYYSPLFLFLQLLLVVNFLLLLSRYHYIRRRKWTVMVLHASLIIILGGALTTHLFGREGEVHIREGESSDEMVIRTTRGTRLEKLPFRLELIDFRLHRYPGSESPSSYESSLRVHVDGEVRETEIYMNNVLDLKGYRFFQASYDPDEKGTILSVNWDPVGRSITYSGYLLLLIGFVMMFLMPGSRFRKLIRSLRELRASAAMATFLLLMMIPAPFAVAATGESQRTALQYVVPPAHAARFGTLPVQFRGRIMPMNSFSSEILRKLHKETSIDGLNGDQFLLGLLSMPQQWMELPLIALPGGTISQRYQLPEEHAAYMAFFDKEGSYRLLPELQQIYHRPAAERSSADKELIKLDERINIFYQLLHHTMPALFPRAEDPDHTWVAPGEDLSLFVGEDSIFVTGIFNRYLTAVRHSLLSGDWQEPDRLLQELTAWQLDHDTASLIHPQKIEAEIRYNRMHIFRQARLGYFIFGGLLLIFAFMHLLRERKWLHYASNALGIAIFVIFLFHLYGIGLRWYIAGHAPWSNSYETMVYIAWVTVLAGLIFGRRNSLTLALATLFGGVILFVSGLNWMDPQINTLVPVLKSPWLMFHVAVIVAAYGFFGISFLLGVTNLLLMSFSHATDRMMFRIRELGIINNLSLLAGLALMTIGTFLGAVWANESWGRYWGWDPKETWALITVVIYSVVTHLHLVKRWYSDWLFNLLSVLAFASVLMTFFGVNYFLSGMHSYGQTDASSSVFVYIAAAFFAIGLLGVVSYKKGIRYLVHGS
ncbi:MAG: Cytochrome c biogenesis protein [Proteiniphilum acetatigenes]|uniref:Cytochrome c biogenesis protein n=1 Tax=Proteiniphilum acetatigenes TaxID=294710 RepID=A0A101HKX8_9BACT|nr:MAG: Cytochrome c biogenesis protein [Proteiniphilum acetatigenes]